MKKTDASPQFPQAFATQADQSLVAYPLPQTKQSNGRVSFLEGFPIETFTPLSAGGVPPSGADFNGLFRTITEAMRVHEAGVVRSYDTDYARAINGYPMGALVSDPSDPTHLLISKKDDNVDDIANSSAWMSLSDSVSASVGRLSAALDGKLNRSGDTLTGDLTVDGKSYLKQQLNLNGYNTDNSNALSIGSESLPNGASSLIGGSVARDYHAYMLQLFKDAANIFSIDNTGEIQTPAGAKFGGDMNIAGKSYLKQQLNLNGYNTGNSNALSIGSEPLPNGASSLIGGSVARDYNAYMLQLFKDAANVFSIDNNGQIQTPAGAQFGGDMNIAGKSYLKQQLNLNGYNTDNSNALSIGSEPLPNGASSLIGGSVARDYNAYMLQLFKDAANVFSIDNKGEIQTPAGAKFGGDMHIAGKSYLKQQLNLNGYNTDNSNALSIGSEPLPNGASSLIGGSVSRDYGAYMLQLFKDAANVFSIDNNGEIQTPAGAQFGNDLTVSAFSSWNNTLFGGRYNTRITGKNTNSYLQTQMINDREATIIGLQDNAGQFHNWNFNANNTVNTPSGNTLLEISRAQTPMKVQSFYAPFSGNEGQISFPEAFSSDQGINIICQLTGTPGQGSKTETLYISPPPNAANYNGNRPVTATSFYYDNSQASQNFYAPGMYVLAIGPA